MDFQIPLGIAAVVFGGFVLSRLWPAVGGNREAREALAAARAKLKSASTNDERAEALALVGDACSQRASLRRMAASYYARALKLRPSDAALVRRVAIGLARRPWALETLLVRRLGATSWKEREVTTALLESLLALYRGQLRSVARAQMIERALEEVTGELPLAPPSQAIDLRPA